MTYRELSMIDIRELIRRIAAGQSDRKVARDAGTDRKTVARYRQVFAQLGVATDVALTDDLIHEIAQRVQARREPPASEQWGEIAKHRARIEAWLCEKRPLRLSKIHTLLVRDHGLEASYATLRRYAADELGWRKKTLTVLVADGKPGEEAQVDFGLMGLLADDDGRQRQLWVLIVTLVFSRYQFVWPSFAQTTEAVCEGLDAAWRFFGGVLPVVIPDNMKAIISRADPLCPRLVEAFADYVQSRDILVDPARVRTPRDKGRVENQVPYVRESWFDGEKFLSLADARQSAETWCRDVAGARVHGTTRQVPREVFLAEEKPLLKPAPTTVFDVPVWSTPKVHPDHHVQVARSLYSVPSRYVGKTMRARADKTTVRIYLGTDLVKTHPRIPPGKRMTDPTDYPDGKSELAFRSVDGLIERAQAKGKNIGTYAEKLLAGPLPWTRMRQAYGLLRLCDRFGTGRVEAVCQSSLAFDVVDVRRIERMLAAATKPAMPAAAEAKVIPIATPRFARSAEHFGTCKAPGQGGA